MILQSQAIRNLRPNTEWRLEGADVANIEWLTEGVEPLTQAEVTAEVARLEAAAVAATAERAAARAALLERLGISEDEAVLLREAGI